MRRTTSALFLYFSLQHRLSLSGPYVYVCGYICVQAPHSTTTTPSKMLYSYISHCRPSCTEPRSCRGGLPNITAQSPVKPGIDFAYTVLRFIFERAEDDDDVLAWELYMYPPFFDVKYKMVKLHSLKSMTFVPFYSITVWYSNLIVPNPAQESLKSIGQPFKPQVK